MQTNQVKTFIFLGAIVGLFVVVGGLIGGKSGMLIALAFASVMNLLAYWNSDKMVLSMYNAQEVGPHNAPDLYLLVQRIISRTDLPMPRVYVINEEQPNAFATGRNPENAAVAFTIGIIQLLSEAELEGVIAHEISHIKHRDILLSTISATVAGAIAGLANVAMWFGVRDEEGHRNWLASLLVAILAPLAATVIQLAISRSREYLADEGAAYLTGKPLALANALLKIEAYAKNILLPTAEEHPATAQMMIINPLHNDRNTTDNLFSTHPATQNRVEQLQKIARAMNQF